MAIVIENVLGDQPTSDLDTVLSVNGTTLGTVAGEVLFGFVTCSAGRTVDTVDTDFTLVGPIDRTGYFRSYYFYKTAASNNEGATVTFSAGYNGGSLSLMRISGANAATLAQNAKIESYGANANWNNVTVAADGSLILWLLESDMYAHPASMDVTPPGGTNETYVFGTSSVFFQWIGSQLANTGMTTGITVTSTEHGFLTYAVVLGPSASGPAIPVLLNQYRQRTTH